LPPPTVVEAAGQSGVEHGVGTVAAPDGTPLFVQWWSPAEKPRGVLVVLHGLKDHSSRYSAFAQGLVRRGFAVHAFDLRGHGKSGGPAVRVESFEDYTGDLDWFVRDVKARHPDVPLFLLGHSMGGAIALATVLDKAPPVDGLVLSAAALKPGADVNPALIAVTAQLGRFLPDLPVLNLDDAAFTRDTSQAQQDGSDVLIHHKPGPARTAAELLATMQRNADRFEKVTLPILVLHGTADRLTNPEGSRELHARAGSADKTLKLYPDCFHDLLHEPVAARAAVVGDVTAWLESHLQAAPAVP
jgi:alpha-beta hydrolase superfamily lysophospholipase